MQHPTQVYAHQTQVSYQQSAYPQPTVMMVPSQHTQWMQPVTPGPSHSYVRTVPYHPPPQPMVYDHRAAHPHQPISTDRSTTQNSSVGTLQRTVVNASPISASSSESDSGTDERPRLATIVRCEVHGQQPKRQRRDNPVGQAFQQAVRDVCTPDPNDEVIGLEVQDRRVATPGKRQHKNDPIQRIDILLDNQRTARNGQTYTLQDYWLEAYPKIHVNVHLVYTDLRPYQMQETRPRL